MNQDETGPTKDTLLIQRIVCEIVASTLGGSTLMTLENVARAARQLGAADRDDPTLKVFALFCEQLLLARKNPSHHIDSNGELWLLRALAQFTPQQVFDVGANIGDWTLAALSELPSARIHAFEILDQTSAVLVQRVAGQGRVTINRIGLGDHDGAITMHQFDPAGVLTSAYPYPHGPHQKIKCSVRRGDDYLTEHDIDRIDLLKLDAEGAEPMILAGFESALDAGRIDVIQFEYGKMSIINHFLLRDFYLLLEPKGYVIGKLYPDRVDFKSYALEDDDFVGLNYVAVRRSRADIVTSLTRP